MDKVFEMHSYRILHWNPIILNPQSLVTCGQAIDAKGTPLENCFGFIDGTVRPICRPRKNQRIVYNGHKRVHALKFLLLETPNGLIANLYGPVGKFRQLKVYLKDLLFTLIVCT